MKTRFHDDPMINQVYPEPCLLVGTCFLLVVLGVIGCVRTPTPTVPRDLQDPQRMPEFSEASSHTEAQLLQTLKTAEGLGKGNPLLFSSLYSLATYYRDQGEYDKAESQYKRALTIKEEVGGPDHPDIILILHKYAALLRDAHRYSEAENLIVRAKAINAKSPSQRSSP